MSLSNTIAAISTPSGKGGVAIIRISGDEALAVALKVFKPKDKKISVKDNPRVQIYGDIYRGDEYIDDGLITYFSAPKSYTGEDIVEISCHGGMLVSRAVLEAIFIGGAVPAEPGEFTRRAFINGKLTLTEAEAIGSLLEAKSYEQIKLTSQKSRTKLKDKLSSIRESLVELLSSIYARIDYPDEDLGDFSRDEMLDRLYNIKEEISALISTYPTGKAISEGINTVICGRPNVGKSSLYNAILGEDAAIVTDIEGTTRDILTREVPLGRVMLKLSDTAGVRREDLADTVERIGIERTQRAIQDAELIIAVFDASSPLTNEDISLINSLESVNSTKIAILNKCDLECKIDFSEYEGIFAHIIKTSILENDITGVRELSDLINTLFTDEKINASDTAIISSARHNASLNRAIELVKEAIEATEIGIYDDASSSLIEGALGAIAEIDGRAVCEEVVSDIFSKFCVGK